MILSVIARKQHGHIVELKNNFMDGVVSKLKKDHVKWQEGFVLT